MDQSPSPTFSRHTFRLALLLAFLCLSYLATAQSYYVNYSLPSAGKVSVNIYDEKGNIVRELLHGQSQTAGSYTLSWDGKDGKGNTVANPLQHKWKLLKTPSGLQAEFITGVGSSYPYGANRQWEAGLGNHEGTSSVAVDETHAYVAAGGGENVRTQVKLDRSLSQLVFSGWQPDIGQGYFARTILEGKIYGLQADGYVSFHNTSEINKMYQSVGTSANYVGSRWDALYPGKTRPGRGQIAMMQLMDMAGARIATTSHLVISYKDQNLIQWRNPANGTVLDQVSVSAPLGVAIDNAGNVLAISQGKVVRFSRTNKTLVQVIAATALDSPWRLDVDRSTGEILVAEKGGGNQVKKFSSSGSLLKTYGRKSGRAFGLHVPTDFYDISDICSDNKGGFYVTEPGKSAIPRVAYINSGGSLVKELVGGTTWTAFGQAEQNDPTVVWLTLGNSCLIRAKVDLQSKSWSVHSVYNINLLSESKMHYNGSMGTGLSVWKPLVHNNTTYLCFDMGAGEPEVKIIKVDESNWKLLPAVNIRFGYDNNDYNYGAIWTDANGDGLLQDSEKRRIKYLPYIRNLRVMPDFTYIYDRYSLGTIAMLKVKEWNGAGSPVYEDFPTKDFAPWPAFMLKSNGQSNAYVASHYFATEGAGYPLYTAVGMGDKGWGTPEEVHLLKFNADGSLAWRAGRNTKTKNYYDMNHTIQPGEIWSAFKNTVGVVHECVVAADFNGGYNGRTDWTAFTYVWDKDGLWVGGLFDNPNTSVAPMTAYTQSSENGAGGLYEDAGNGTVYYYGGAENEVRIYKISGWDNWYRANGTVVNGANTPPAPTLRTPENPANTTSGLDYSYYEGTWSDIPDYSSLTAVKTGTVTSISLTNRNRNDFYGFKFSGYISVPTDGEYTFYTTSDDGSRLYIGSTLVVDNGGSHGSIEKSGKIGLKAGKHSFSVTYFEDDGGEALSVSYAGTNISKQVIPGSVLYRTSTSPTPTPSEGTGLSATYYDNMDLTGSTMKRIDATVCKRFSILHTRFISDKDFSPI